MSSNIVWIKDQGLSYHRDWKAHRNAWFLDSSFSNHMCGDRAMFSELNEGFRHLVKLGNKMHVVGK